MTRGTSQRSTAEGLLTSMLLTRSLTESIQRIPSRTSGMRMLSFLPTSSLSLCFSSDFLFLRIEDGRTFIEFSLAAPFTFDALPPQQHFFPQIPIHTRKSQKPSKNLNLKKIHFETSFLISTTSYRKSQKSPKKFESQKNSLLLYMLVILSLPIGLCRLFGMLTGHVPHTTDPSTALFCQVFTSPLL